MSRPRLIKIACLLALMLAPVLTNAADGLIVSLKAAECPWADVHLENKLGLYLSHFSRIPVIRQNLPDGSDQFPFEDLLQWGVERGGRYLVDIEVDRIELERRKVTVFPYLFYRYRVYAVMSGRIRIIDLQKQRVEEFKNILYEIKASDQWQVAEDNKFDPALSVPADEKTALFQQLEDKAAKELFKEIKELTRGNHFGS